MIDSSALPLKHASIFIGAFFCLLVSACGEKKSTPNWKNEPSEKGDVSGDSEKNTPTTSATQANGQPVRFLAYNLRNYLTMRRYVNGKASSRSKPEEEIAPLIEIIQNAHPDILGVCEIGSPQDLKDFQSRLKKAGIDLPHTYRAYGGDRVRALAILSRFPIVSTALPKKFSYELNGIPFKISRGILDATIQLPDKKVRFLGVHLKSKRPIEGADQELMRRNESMLLRKHIEDILSKSPDTLLMAYGDFNDTKRTKAVYTIKGRANSKNYMEMLELVDSRDENWTHNWKREDIYSRFDYMMVNRKLAPFIDRKSSRLLDPKSWEKASDHRALLVLIK
jgi:endonuclease/exonuclease/phosphatase family metal-dependent hydrolase